MYLPEIVKKVSLEQAGMLVAVLKAKVKVRANLSDRIIELSHLAVLPLHMGERNCRCER